MPTELKAARHFNLECSLAPISSAQNDSILPSLLGHEPATDLDQFHLGYPSGRLGSNGLVSFIPEFFQSGKRWACYGVGTALREIGFEHLALIVEKGFGNLDLPGGAKAKIQFSEKTYESKDPYILQDDIRKACCQIFNKNNREIKWVESKGYIELEGEPKQNLSLSDKTGCAGEMQLSSLLRYRRLELYESPCGTLEKETTLYNALQIPVTANLANQMPVGSEFEVICEGHALLKPELVGVANLYENSLGKTTLSGSVGMSNDLEGDVSILVQKLPRSNQVLVKIAQVNGFSSSIQANLAVGTKTDSSIYTNVRQRLTGFFDKMLDKFRLLDWIKTMFNYQASIRVENAAKESSHDIKRYVFDFSDPNAQMAYNEIFSQFSTSKADELVSLRNKGVRSQSGGETVNSFEYRTDADVGSAKVWLNQSQQSEREGKLINNPQDVLIFRESRFLKKYFDWFSGEKTISWESVTLKDPVTKRDQRYYHLLYKNSDRITQQAEIDQFLNFSKALGIDIGDDQFRKHVDIQNLAHIFNDRDDTLALVDIYFTDKGIENIKNAPRNELMVAHLTAQSKMDFADTSFPFLQKTSKGNLLLREESDSYRLVQRYKNIKNKWFMTRWWYQQDLSAIENQYLQLTGRKIEPDTKAFNEANLFAEKMIALKKKENLGGEDEQLFSLLGRLMGFDYTKTIAAMAIVAQEKETIIHGLSMSAGGMSLRGVDEGEIIHPEREVLSALASLA